MPPPQEGSEAHARGLPLLGAIHAATPVLPEQGVPSAPAPRRQRAWRQMTRRAGAHPNLMTSAPGVSALVRALETMEEELAIRGGGKIVYCERKGNIRVDVRARGRAKRSAPRKAAACAPGGTEGQ